MLLRRFREEVVELGTPIPNNHSVVLKEPNTVHGNVSLSIESKIKRQAKAANHTRERCNALAKWHLQYTLETILIAHNVLVRLTVRIPFDAMEHILCGPQSLTLLRLLSNNDVLAVSHL